MASLPSTARASSDDPLASLAANVAGEKGADVERARMADFECPSYDHDEEVGPGMREPARQFCQRLTAADAFLIVSPEYNASMPGVLKNAIDWVSRFRPAAQRPAGTADVGLAVDGRREPRPLESTIECSIDLVEAGGAA